MHTGCLVHTVDVARGKQGDTWINDGNQKEAVCLKHSLLQAMAFHTSCHSRHALCLHEFKVSVSSECVDIWPGIPTVTDASFISQKLKG